MALIGYLLSPLSWWNDLFVNVPLALAFAWLISLLFPAAFAACFVLGYWLTNVLGLILLHKGVQANLSKEHRSYTRKDLIRDLVISIAYTLIIIILVRLRILEPLPVSFPKH